MGLVMEGVGSCGPAVGDQRGVGMGNLLWEFALSVPAQEGVHPMKCILSA